MRIFCWLLPAVLVLGLLSFTALARPSNMPAGYTGAPAVSGRDCTACHSGTTNSGPGKVALQAASVYAPGSVIPVRVALSNLQNSSANGLQMAAYDTNNALLSGWISIDGDTTVSSNHVNHTRQGNARSAWQVYFSAPVSPTTFTIYTAGLDGDNRGNTSGDRVYTTSLKMTAGTVNLSMTALPSIGASVPLALNAPGDGSKAYVMAASLGASGINVGGRTIPLSLDPLLILTVQNLVPSIFQGYQGVLSAPGTATAKLIVPSMTALRGLTLHHAFVVIDPSRPNGLGTISNGLGITLF